jgi:6-phosphofructokinase 2
MSPRIVTLTLNPAIDVACEAERVFPQHKVRTSNETHDPGGGGVNVARVVHELGGNTCAIVLTGGVTGRHLVELLEGAGIPCRAVPIIGPTRISLTVQEHATGHEYRFVPEGPLFSPAELAAAEQAVAAEPADWLVASGSLPRGAGTDFYAHVARHHRTVAVDTSGEALRAVLGHGVALIKPSLGEFEALVGRKLPTEAAQNEAATALVRSGAVQRIAVSLGAEGGLLASADGLWRRPAITVPVRGSVGAGDSFLAALVLALARGDHPPDALAWAIAAGAAAVMQTGTAHPSRADIEALYRKARNEE